MDTLSTERRSDNMRRIRGKNTSVELALRMGLRKIGFPGYRLHRSDLPGCPDCAFMGRKVAIFVHGCFWHGHTCREGSRQPKSNRRYWLGKIEGNRNRDARNVKLLRKAGWRVITIWECEFRSPARVSNRLLRVLQLPRPK